ncbi:glycosyl hydrolase family 47-domain-containing protein [Calycina marina]|uniref:alpha-1,2-Mannosidase n=1 Tax=Calycina marina TaxID=1763456 RepID=A0A9P7YZP6_9HELO|nr:glycosyl hydrolase family 47-domain-containing protein [Calycina marina]
MDIAFPEDELRPVSCEPLTRDSKNPGHVELNDVLGNYSLTLIDSLSTLAILASAPPDQPNTGDFALRVFQDGVKSLIAQYGDGTKGPAGKGLRARGFDVDSKVQVFETVIRGVGGLVSAHLFAAGELPINGYTPQSAKKISKTTKKGHIPAIKWPNRVHYDGQLLRLALDLAQRLLPAFYTATGMPYPRVNLRHGIPFYLNSPLHDGTEDGEFEEQASAEITETCSAGAGSLVLEFTVLSRLTGDMRFEQLAKRAFWAVWERRSNIGLIGAGVDAENGQWIGPYAGIGAGTDSFFEYALKSSILLSGHETPNTTITYDDQDPSWIDPNTIYTPLSDEENSSEAFLAAWHESHAAIRRHLYSSTHHPHYVNVHLTTGSPQTYWIDSLGAYYPGLLTMAGEVEEAIETNLLYTALWTRYAALPERWSVRDGQVEGGLGWWPGRPEFIESNYHLYRATGDPWYLHVGEMVLEDIKSRCWTDCGWSGLQDVLTGEKSDRMESFFLGETAKYLYLLFDPDHPLNKLDAAYVFTTEGHPLLIPKQRKTTPAKRRAFNEAHQHASDSLFRDTCPAPPADVPFTGSATAARRDIFHASSLIGLHMIPNSHATEVTILEKPTQVSTSQNAVNHTYYPWTLPPTYIPDDGFCDKLPIKTTFSIEFPKNALLQHAPGSPTFAFGSHGLIRVNEGILVKTLSGLQLGMVYESPSPFRAINGPLVDSWRVWNIANIPLGRDEQVLIGREVIGDMTDPSFSRVRDSTMLDIVVQTEDKVQVNSTEVEEDIPIDEDDTGEVVNLVLDDTIRSAASGLASEYRTMLSSLINQVTSVLRDPVATLLPEVGVAPARKYTTIPAITPTGIGAAPVLDVAEAPNPYQTSIDSLSWSQIYFAKESCAAKLPDAAVRKHQIIVMKRGGCTFSDKLANIPSFTPSSQGLKLVIIVSGEGEGDDDGHQGFAAAGSGGRRLIRPLMDKAQVTPSGLLRHHQISMVMVGGGEGTMKMLKSAKSIGLRRRYHIQSQGLVVGNIVVV